MSFDSRKELYQRVILEHNKNPKNFREMENATHMTEGYNPLCGDHLIVYLHINDENVVEDLSFKGDGCAISKASASMMTQSLKGKTVDQAKQIFEEFHALVTGQLKPDEQDHHLGKLAIFSGIWHFPARVKCASLSWHTMRGAMDSKESVSTE